MALKFKGDLVHTEKYQDKQTGEEKKKYTKLGALFEREDGSLTVKMLDSWLNVYPPKMKGEHYEQAKKAVGGGLPDDSDIPFARHDDFLC